MALANLSTKKKANSGAEIAILHPVTSVPVGIFITVQGCDSETFKAIQRRQTNHRLEVAAKNARSRGKANNEITADTLEDNSLELVVGCTTAWRTEIKEKDEHGKEIVKVSRPSEVELDEGEWLPCTPENVRRLYEEFPWLKEQIDLEIGDRSNFLPG